MYVPFSKKVTYEVSDGFNLPSAASSVMNASQSEIPHGVYLPPVNKCKWLFNRLSKQYHKQRSVVIALDLSALIWTTLDIRFWDIYSVP
jgi:hypothetical protein